MSEDKKENHSKQISINAQYVKDLSFESPKSPASLTNKAERPNIDIGIDVLANKVGEDIYEVSLVLNAKAKKEEDVIFLAELTYAGVFTVRNIDTAQLEPALLVFCPTMLFPFARRVMADITRDGGFPPLMLDPIDFNHLYQQKALANKKNGSSDKASEEKQA